MTLPLVIWLLMLIVAVVTAATLQLILDSKGRPLGPRMSWLLWSALSALGIGLAAALANASFAAGLLMALLLGPLVPPAFRAWMWLEDAPYRLARKQEAEEDVQRYRPVTFTEGAPEPRKAIPAPLAPAAPPPTETPLTLARGVSRPTQATATPRSPPGNLAGAAWALAVAGALPLLVVGSLIANGMQSAPGVPGRRAIVAAELEILGYEGARLERDWIQLYCTGGDGEGYLWTSGPADGRACVWPGGVQIKVDRSRMAKDPFARPAG